MHRPDRPEPAPRCRAGSFHPPYEVVAHHDQLAFYQLLPALQEGAAPGLPALRIRDHAGFEAGLTPAFQRDAAPAGILRLADDLALRRQRLVENGQGLARRFRHYRAPVL